MAKLTQYLNEAHASETALVRVLQSQIAMTPRGSYREALEQHLSETQGHARSIEQRLGELRDGANPLQAVVGAAESVVGQAESVVGQVIALTKTPLDLVRGHGHAEKVLKNAKDAAATEALEIATYTAIERLAQATGDDQTARLAASIRADEERMLARVLRELPELTDAVLGDGAEYDLASTGVGETVRAAGRATKRAARTPKAAGKPPLEGYDELTGEQIVRRLPLLSQVELAELEAYERQHANRPAVVERAVALRGDEPWPGYDDLSASEIGAALAQADGDRVAAVKAYEREHKDRASVLNAA